ncbi:hypothetical protein [Thalassospira xiamenensis]|uniref:Uncharacterized protein n=1 Tax=Thalassospira xiamenensis TaxID=220697 RepID=A0A367XER2_9PROT|nr:hypothetical protein [Thalassospira xiamenensis]RCK51909.1 hypothetical protein TH44_05690 [Thalassospira xiamenensis]
MKLYLHRMNLKKRTQIDIEEFLLHEKSVINRELWLRDVFSKQFEFAYRGSSIFFVPEPSETTTIDPKYIVGWLARDRTMSERSAPWEGLEPKRHLFWKAALILIDPTHHEDGQKIAFQYQQEVGKPEPILDALAKYLSNPLEQSWGPYSVSIYPIIHEKSFFIFAEQHRGKIKEITYEISVPNMFNSPDDFSNEMRDLRDRANVSKVRAKLMSDETINTDASQLSEVAEHVEKGGGEIQAKTISGEHYRSSEHAVSVEVQEPNPESDEDTQGFWNRIGRALSRIF